MSRVVQRQTGWRVLMPALALLVGLVSPGPASGSLDAHAAAAPRAVTGATVILGRAAVAGQGVAGATLSGELVTANGRVRASAPETTVAQSGAFTLEFAEADGQPAPLMAGDRLRVRENGAVSLDVRVPTLTVDGDPATDTVSGTAPAGATVTVQAYNLLPIRPATQTATVDAAGQYSASFAGQFDLVANSTVRATVTQGVLTVRIERPLGEQFQVRLYGPDVYGFGPTGATARGSLSSGAGIPKAVGEAATGFLGYFNLTLANGAGEPVPVTPNDRLKLDFMGVQTLDFVIPDVTAVPDVGADSVTGVAPAGSAVAVTAAGVTVNTTAGADGRYSAAFAGQVDIQPGTTGQAVATVDPRLTVARSWAVTRLVLTLGAATVTGSASAGPPIRLVLSDAGGTQLAQATVQATAGGIFGGGGTLTADMVDGAGRPVPLSAGQVLRWRRGGEDFDLTLPVLTARPDIAADKVAGQAPPGATVDVTATNLAIFAQTRQATADAAGRYEADFAGAVDIVAGTAVRAQLTLPAGHQVIVNTAAATLRVWPELGRVDGTVQGGTDVAVTVTSGQGQARATGAATAGFLGQFEAELVDAAGATYLPQTGDRIGVAFGTTRAEMVVPALSVDWNVAEDRVFGEATLGGTVTVGARPPTGRGAGRVVDTVPVMGAGAYAVDLAGRQDLTAGSRLDVTYTYPNGDRARIDRVLPQLNVQIGGNAVFGYALPRARVLATVAPGGGAGRASAAADQAFDLRVVDDAGRPFVLAANQELTVDVGGRFLSVPLGPLTARIDPAARALRGTGPVSATLEARLVPATGAARSFTVATDATGAYSRTVPASLALAGGTTAEVGYWNEDGHRLFTRAVVPRLVAYIGTTQVAGLAPPLAEVALTLELSGGGPAGAGAARADSAGDFATSLTGSRPRLFAGDRLSARADGATVGMTVQAVRVAIDTVADRITGQVPVGQGALARFATLRVYLVGTAAPRTVVAATNAAGEFSVDPANPGLRAQPFSLGAVSRVEAVHTLPEGHQTIATATPRWQVWLPYGLKPR